MTRTDTDIESGPQRETAELNLLAGIDAGGQAVFEKVRAEIVSDESYRALHSPLFVRGLARHDLFTMARGGGGRFTLKEHSGFLALRLFRREHIDQVDEWLSPQVEKLDGIRELRSPNALVYSLHVNIGFSAVETLFDNAASQFMDCMWYYGNVYDPRDGTTPLNWWDSFINQT